MNKKFKILILSIILTLTSIIPLTSIGSSTSYPNEKLRLIFRENLPPQEVLSMIQGTQAQLISFQHNAKLGDEIIDGGYFVKSQNQDKILKDYQISHLGFLKDLASAKNKKVESLDPKAKQARESHFTQIEQELAKGDPFQDVKIESIVVTGNREKLSNLPEIKEIKIISKKVNSNPQNVTSPNGPQITAVDSTKWVPAQGSSYLYPSVIGGRYVQQNMYWNSWWNVSGFGTSSTYEHDFFLNNYDNRTYLSSSQTIDGIPIVNYWSSNLPRPYLDTRIGDPSSEKAYTIGSADAFYIWPFQQYWYYIRTSNGNASTDNGKINSQLGYRNPNWCYTTWCSYPDPNTPIYRLVSAWNIPAPGTYYWQR